MSGFHDQDQPTQQVPPVPSPAPPGTGSGGPTPPAPPSEDRRRSPVAVFVVIALLFGVLVGLGAALLLRGEDEAAPTERATVATSTTTVPGTPDSVTPQDPTGGGSTGGTGGSGSGSAPTTQAPTSTAAPAPGPKVTSVSAPSTYACSEAPNQPSSGQLTLSWSTTGAQSVTVAIDSPGGAYANGLPASGSLTVPAPCKPDSNTYYVIARAADGTTSSSSTTTQGI